jgi:glycosyltransferase involved in cell wall biosynthesis
MHPEYTLRNFFLTDAMPPYSERLRPRVLVTTPQLGKCGGVSVMFGILQSHLGQRITYFTVGSPAELEGPLRFIFRLVSDTVRFAATLATGRHHVVHLNTTLGLKAVCRDGVLLLIAKGMRRKILVFVHGWEPPGFEKILMGRLRTIFRSVYLQADAFVVLSEETRLKLVGAGYCKNMMVGRTAVDDKIFTEARHRSGRVPPGPVTILVLTRIEPLKGVREAVQAFRILRRTNSNVRLLIAGKGSEFDPVRRETIECAIPDVEFLGHVEGPAKEAAFDKSDIFLFPSTFGEGMPLNVLEAMAHGLAIVTRPVGGIADFFQNGKMGFATESTDPTVFAKLLQQLVANPELRLAMGQFNRSYAQDNFAASHVAKGLQNVYASL